MGYSFARLPLNEQLLIWDAFGDRQNITSLKCKRFIGYLTLKISSFYLNSGPL